jgi:hypothetical protein
MKKRLEWVSPKLVHLDASKTFGGTLPYPSESYLLIDPQQNIIDRGNS